MSTPKVSHIPEGYHALTPYLIVDSAARALEFYSNALGATELFRMDAPGGKIGHAEMQLGDSRLMLADEYPELGHKSPHSVGGTPVGIMLYVPDVDAVFNRAVAAGATSVMAVADQFYGDRNGTLLDPFGHKWTISTHIEDVAPEEMQRRAAAKFAEK